MNITVTCIDVLTSNVVRLWSVLLNMYWTCICITTSICPYLVFLTFIDDKATHVRSQGVIKSTRCHGKHTTCLFCNRPLWTKKGHFILFVYRSIVFLLFGNENIILRVSHTFTYVNHRRTQNVTLCLDACTVFYVIRSISNNTDNNAINRVTISLFYSFTYRASSPSDSKYRFDTRQH